MTARQLAALFALAALWGASYLFIRVAVPALGPFPLAAGRVLLAALVLWAGMRALGHRPALRAHAPKLLILGAVNAALPFALIGAAELRLTASLAAMLTATTPLWGALFGVLWLGERLGMRRGAGLLLGVAGVGVLVGWSPVAMTASTMLSVGAVLVACCGYALAGVYTKRALSGVPAPTLAIGQQLGAAVWLLPPAVWGAPRAHPTTAALLALAALALLCTSVAYLLYFRLIASAGPTKTSTVTYLIPLFGTAWGTLLLGEPVTRGMLLGLACILASVVLVNEVRLRSLLPRMREAAAG
ncbi:MAG TPA: DMT family transporter [Gemmatimonadaceae bacterium]|nr:DMT family transporter [Gemmatimonadaceae bacterium]